MSERQRARWNPEVTLGNVLQIASFLVAIVAGWVALDGRVARNSEEIAEAKFELARTMTQLHETRMVQVRLETSLSEQTRILARIEKAVDDLNHRKLRE